MDELDFFYNSSPKKSPHKNSGWFSKWLERNKIFKEYFKTLPHILTKKERYFILFFLIIIVGTVIAIPVTTFYHFTKPTPDFGGTYKEGVLGEPRFINPILQISDADRDLTNLVYSSLMKNDGKGNLIPDLASHYELSNDSLSYTFFLKKDLKWHDEKPLTADDVVFTIQTIQNPEFGSSQRINWQGVEVTKIDTFIVKFTLKNKYAQFLVNTTIGILPQHIWQDIKPANFSLSDKNIKPIGGGPYRFVKLKKDDLGRIVEYELSAFKEYYFGKPFIQKILIKFYPTEEELLTAYQRNSIDGISFISSDSLKKIKFQPRINLNEINLPRYFALFFNQNQSKELSDKNVRLALAYGTDKNTIIKNILNGEAISIDSPMLPEILNINENIKKYEYNPEFAKQILQNTGWTLNGEVFEKQKKDSAGKITDTQRLELTLVTSDWSELVNVANEIQKQWAKIGIKLNIQTTPTTELQQAFIKTREYQIMLFGEVLTIDPDPFSFWHSSQKRDPGLNLALYDNKDADKLLETARQTLNPEERKIRYDDFQRLVIEDLPAIFLYSPRYVYPVSKKVKGISLSLIGIPSDRFGNIHEWYIETKRIKR